MPISFYTQAYNKKTQTRDKGIRPSVVRVCTGISMRLASILYFLAGGLFCTLSPEKGWIIYTSREYILRLIASECFPFDYRFKRQFAHFLNLVENIFHLFRCCYELAFLTVQFILDHIATFTLFRFDVGLKIHNCNLAILQVAQRCKVPFEPFLPVCRFVRDA